MSESFPHESHESIPSPEQALAAMSEAARSAGKLLLAMQSATLRLATRKDFLTDADSKSETAILDVLSKRYPAIPSYSEEKGGQRLTEGYQWVIDPIDGTVNFFLQDDNWAISIALVKDGVTIAGVVYLPAQGMLFSAAKDSPATVFDEKTGATWAIEVNKEGSLKDSQFWLEWGKEEAGGADHEKVYALIKKLDRASIYPQMRNSAAADSMRVALGRISGLVFLKPDPFDVAAAGLIIERAGGTVTDIEGKPWTALSSSFVATNGVLHDELLKVIRGDA